jgi:hypothetical protein
MDVGELGSDGELEGSDEEEGSEDGEEGEGESEDEVELDEVSINDIHGCRSTGINKSLRMQKTRILSRTKTMMIKKDQTRKYQLY